MRRQIGAPVGLSQAAATHCSRASLRERTKPSKESNYMTMTLRGRGRVLVFVADRYQQ